MANKPKVILNSSGIIALLKDSGLVNDLRKRANSIASAAGRGFEVEVTTGGKRGRAYVFAATNEARRRQNKDHVLERSIDAGRG